jgi:hypothetical protein
MFAGRDTTGFNYFDLLHVEGSPKWALFYSCLFSPDFIDLDGMVFLAATVEDASDRRRVFDALQRFQGDRTQVERSFNVIEVQELFGAHRGDTTEAEDVLLAERLAETWSARLQRAYPESSFTVRVVDGTVTGGGAGIVFYRNR